MFLWPVRVYYEDTDSGGVVYHANYLKFMERARTEWLRSHGFEQDELARRERVIFAVHHMTLAFLRPARFNDRLLVSVVLTGRGAASLSFRQQVVAGEGEGIPMAEGLVFCAGEIRIACLDAATLRPRRIPRSLNQSLLREISGEC